MIVNPEWHKPKEKPYFQQISLNCIDKLVKCIAKFNIGEIDADTSLKISKQILVDEFDDQEFLNFAIENYSEILKILEDQPKVTIFKKHIYIIYFQLPSASRIFLQDGQMGSKPDNVVILGSAP